MKKTVINIISLYLIIVLALLLCSCSEKKLEADIWKEAIYTQDTELGSGVKTVVVEVVTPEKSISFTIHSDKETLGDALLEHNLIEGEQSIYGIYIKKVNGILADYDINESYWGFNRNGESMQTGVDGVKFSDGEHYELVYTK